jgi:hypothetical protein
MPRRERAAQKIVKARAAGCKRPIVAWTEAARAGVPYYVLCAYLEQESSGGMNVFGHDQMRCSDEIKGMRVTKRRYEAYKQRRPTCGMQGVGPMQLTFHSLQDEADALGGCWRPRINIRYGVGLISAYKEENGSWHDAAKRYNGSEEYADRNDLLRRRWKAALGDTDGEEDDA